MSKRQSEINLSHSIRTESMKIVALAIPFVTLAIFWNFTHKQLTKRRNFTNVPTNKIWYQNTEIVET